MLWRDHAEPACHDEPSFDRKNDPHAGLILADCAGTRGHHASDQRKRSRSTVFQRKGRNADRARGHCRIDNGFRIFLGSVPARFRFAR